MDLNKIIPQKKQESNTAFAIVGFIYILISVCFFAYGGFNLLYALFTTYKATTFDLLSLLSGISMLFLVTIVNLLNEVKKQNQLLAQGIVQLLRKTTNNRSNRNISSNFNDTLNQLFNKTSDPNNSEITGSISFFDMDNPEKPLFEGQFNNLEEMNNLKNDLVNKMLNGFTDFKGKKMTRQEMLSTLNLKELKDELETAIINEDWLWAASLRDKIAEKEKGENNN